MAVQVHWTTPRAVFVSERVRHAGHTPVALTSQDAVKRHIPKSQSSHEHCRAHLARLSFSIYGTPARVSFAWADTQHSPATSPGHSTRQALSSGLRPLTRRVCPAGTSATGFEPLP